MKIFRMKKKERKKMTKMTTKRGENHESGQIFQGLLSWSTVLLEIWFCWWFVTLLYAILTPFLGADDFLKDNIIILNAYQMISVIITGSFIIIIWIFFFFPAWKITLPAWSCNSGQRNNSFWLHWKSARRLILLKRIA